ncbi:chemotaxis protein CheC [Bacillus sp. FJAT-47783]|uniref:chemotaxis protein CheC n=1 Tax=Bacillus sp. FJAT-47783 TaxID=2922712 RepID=UPI001FAC14BF|nr:chemotaxis protein CheC [Bacillus sp. FJAT-47783]
MSFLLNISSEKLDALKEVGNIGAGNAATALSHILQKKIYMNVPDAKVGSFEEIIDLIGSEKEVVALYLRLDGDISGSMFFIMSVQNASEYLNVLVGTTNICSDYEMTEIESSALKELGNILIGSYVSALSDLTNLYIYQSVPYLSVDMFGAIISHGLFELSPVSDQALIIDTVIKDHEQHDHDFLKGHIFFLPNHEAYEKIFKKLEV